MSDFEEVYNLYFRDVYKYALSISRDAAMAEEITQETFFKALQSIDRFDGRCRLYVWLCQIAKNTYLSLCRKQHRGEEFEEEPGDDGIEDDVMAKEDSLAIHRILHDLPEPYKEVFSLRTFGELSFAQIAALFGRTESWARVTYYRAKLEIQKRIEEEEHGKDQV